MIESSTTSASVSVFFVTQPRPGKCFTVAPTPVVGEAAHDGGDRFGGAGRVVAVVAVEVGDRRVVVQVGRARGVGHRREVEVHAGGGERGAPALRGEQQRVRRGLRPGRRRRGCRRSRGRSAPAPRRPPRRWRRGSGTDDPDAAGHLLGPRRPPRRPRRCCGLGSSRRRGRRHARGRRGRAARRPCRRSSAAVPACCATVIRATAASARTAGRDGRGRRRGGRRVPGSGSDDGAGGDARRVGGCGGPRRASGEQQRGAGHGEEPGRPRGTATSRHGRAVSPRSRSSRAEPATGTGRGPSR